MSLFGTDGVRGVANVSLTSDLALKLGRATGLWLQKHNGKGIVICRDTRKSGSMLAAALSSGFCSVGIDVATLGIAPTPAASYIVRSNDFDLAAVISASHNPPRDNGIKFFDKNGRKLSEKQEKEVENIFEEVEYFPTENIGVIERKESLLKDYLEWLRGFLKNDSKSLKIVVDAANGGASYLVQELFSKSDMDVRFYGCEPDGENINVNCGATSPETIRRLTVEEGADIGIAFDGDADRCIFCDERGNLINGDRFMGIWAVHQKNKNRLEPPIVVGTVMSNTAFENALKSYNIQFIRTPVGDRNVSQKMEELQAKIGGEQSGHIIFGDFVPTGDGFFTALQMISILQETKLPASKLPPLYDNMPQILVNVRVEDRNWESKPRIVRIVENAKEELSSCGRIVLRASGTQPVIRVMVEAKDINLRDSITKQIVDALISECKGCVASSTDLTNSLGE
ncbi:MAG TPA: phosphoglucosamine mutase [Fimbriimonadales bacterium]|nr:phosphoglucosamine mutase [Fimbriimonadales bacterium]